MRVKCLELRIEGSECELALRAGSCAQHSTLNTQLRRRGFTLVELLIVIMIIAILAALVLGVAAIAGETARESHSRHMVERLHTLLTEYYDTYKTRRVKLRPQIVKGINDPSEYSTAAARGNAMAQARLYALRELMMMEVPDRWSDILLTDVPSNPASALTSANLRYPYFEDPQGLNNGRTALANVFLRRYAQIADPNFKNSITSAPNTPEQITDNQGAECLYMIITLACGDGEARTLFAENTIGDVDGDGAPEFLDGWGHPINFLRWAPGFESQIQINANSFQSLSVNQAWTTAASKDHDPFDMFRVDPPAFRLVPLIYSGGRDETFGIRLVKPHVAMYGAQANLSTTTSIKPLRWPIILPWAPVKDPDPSAETATVLLGTMNSDGTATDNIHNHLLGQR